MGVLLDQQDGHALRFQIGDDLEDRARDQRRKPERRLVEQHQPRPRHQGARDDQHLLLTARQRAGDLIDALGKNRKAIEHPVADRVRCPAIPAARKAPRRRFSRTVSSRKRATAFRNIGDAEARDLVGLAADRAAPSKFDVAAADGRPAPSCAFSSVLLPAPLAPTSVTTSPSSTVSETRSSATTLP